MTTTTTTLPRSARSRSTLGAVAAAAVAAALAIAAFGIIDGESRPAPSQVEPARYGSADSLDRRMASVGHVGSADALERRVVPAGGADGSTLDVGSADAAARWSGR